MAKASNAGLHPVTVWPHNSHDHLCCSSEMQASILTRRIAKNFRRALSLSGRCSVIDFGVERARNTDQGLM